MPTSETMTCAARSLTPGTVRNRRTAQRDRRKRARRFAKVEIAVHLRVELAQVQAQQEAVPLGDACGPHGPQLLGRRFDAMLRHGKLK